MKDLGIIIGRDVRLTKSTAVVETRLQQPRQSRAISAATSCAEIGLNSTMERRCWEMVSDPMYIGRFGSMKWNILVGSMVLGASLCGQSFGGDLLHRLLGGNGCGARSSCCDTSVCDPTCGAEIAACDPCGKGPSCGAEQAPCGSGCGTGPSCGAEIASCGPCNAAPSCGAEVACADPCGTPVCVRTPVLDKLKGLKCKLVAFKNRLHAHGNRGCDNGCSDPCAPSCGAEAPCGGSVGPNCGAEIASCGPCNAAPTCGAEIACNDPCAAPACDSGCGSKKRHGGLLNKLFSHKKGCDSIACDACPTAGCSSCTGTAAPAAAPAAAPVTPAPAADPHAYMNTNRRVIQASSTRVR